MLNDKSICLIEVLYNRFHSSPLINREPTFINNQKKKRTSTEDYLKCMQARTRAQNNIAYVSSLVACGVKPEMRYFLLMLPRCVTSTLTPRSAFLIYYSESLKRNISTVLDPKMANKKILPEKSRRRGLIED